MKLRLERYLPSSPMIIFAMIFFQVVASWVFVGWFHYKSQYRTLTSDAYMAEIISEADYALLQNPNLNSVTLSNGTTVTDRQPVWYKTILPNYKKVGDQYVLVTTVGTAHYYNRWMQDALPILFWSIAGLFCSGYVLHNSIRKRA